MGQTWDEYQEKRALTADASNRAVRTFVVGLAVDVAVGLAAAILAGINAVSDKASLIAFGLLLAKTFVTSICSFVLRRFLDGSGIPTPLPPAPAVQPNSTIPPSGR